MNEENRYDSNAKSVRKMCDIMGYRLIGFFPNWSLARVEETLPINQLELMSNQILGRYDKIPDEFMGRIALIMGFDWKFPIEEDQLKILINQWNEQIKDTEKTNELRMERLKKVGYIDDRAKKIAEDVKKDCDEYLNEIKAECNEKIRSIESMIQFREKLRKWKSCKSL